MGKKLLFVCLMVLVEAVVFAEDIIVQSVAGKVTMEATPDKWVDVKVGDKLAATIMVNTGLNSKLVLKIGTRLVTVNPMTKKTVAMLIGTTAAAGSVTAVTNTQNTGISATSTQTSTNIATASTRASDATGEVSGEEGVEPEPVTKP